jgi:hypothetical protein
MTGIKGRQGLFTSRATLFALQNVYIQTVVPHLPIQRIGGWCGAYRRLTGICQGILQENVCRAAEAGILFYCFQPIRANGGPLFHRLRTVRSAGRRRNGRLDTFYPPGYRCRILLIHPVGRHGENEKYSSIDSCI